MTNTCLLFMNSLQVRSSGISQFSKQWQIWRWCEHASKLHEWMAKSLPCVPNIGIKSEQCLDVSGGSAVWKLVPHKTTSEIHKKAEITIWCWHYIKNQDFYGFGVHMEIPNIRTFLSTTKTNETWKSALHKSCHCKICALLAYTLWEQTSLMCVGTWGIMWETTRNSF